MKVETAQQDAAGTEDLRDHYALIGAGPMGLAMAKTLIEQGITLYRGFETAFRCRRPVGHRRPEVDHVRDRASDLVEEDDRIYGFPDGQRGGRVSVASGTQELFPQFRGSFRNLCITTASKRKCYRTEPLGKSGDGWRVTWREADGTEHQAEFAGVLIANGTLSEPNMPEFKGSFSGELMHSSAYRDPEIFKGKRVLIIGAGNSGCDIAVDAIHHGKACDISMRRGYYFVPKYVFGRPADTMGGAIKLPMWLKRRIDGMILKWFTGDPSKYGFPKPDYALYESHPVVNSLILFHAGHGDITVRPDIDRFDGNTVHFKDGTRRIMISSWPRPATSCITRSSTSRC
jgi:hypothetical protein